MYLPTACVRNIQVTSSATKAKHCKEYNLVTENTSFDPDPAVGTPSAQSAIVIAGDYLNKLTGEKIERECRDKLNAGAREIVVDFSETEIINSIGISILLGVIDDAQNAGAKVVFSDLKPESAELFDMLGLTKHVTIQ
ncbi:MAG: anti-sigma factor antagonist [Acidobacteria bacterium ACB1]|nr:anti-sigma factor antagonist [Acidobacteria bacterium ACB1]RIJ94078.1 MAG: hypothetical protein DCC44_05590 [Acidobacteriota bacterium]